MGSVTISSGRPLWFTMIVQAEHPTERERLLAVHAVDEPRGLAPRSLPVSHFSTRPIPIRQSTIPVAIVDSGSAPEDMLRVPGGTFTMGADTGGEGDERPAHEVTLGAFWLDRTEVTQAAYDACVEAKSARRPTRRS